MAPTSLKSSFTKSLASLIFSKKQKFPDITKIEASEVFYPTSKPVAGQSGKTGGGIRDYLPADIGTGSISVKVDKPISGPGPHGPSVDLTYEHKVLDGKHGNVIIGAGANKRPGEPVDSHVSMEATWSFGK